MITDRDLGIIGLTISALMGCVLLLLVIIPILPLSDNHLLLKLFSPQPIILFSACFSLIFLGTLGILSVYIIYLKDSNVSYVTIKQE